MNILVFDTETTNLEKPFCYNIGYAVYDTINRKILKTADWIVEQIWHNMALFTTAYYAEKRPIYVNRMKGKTVFMKKFGYITQQMCKVIEDFDIHYAYAYNSSFDEKVFNFNCDWFKCINPFDNVEILDIRGLVHNKIAFSPDFQEWCEKHERFTESGNYSTTAETLYQYLVLENFEEEHTALSDSLIELTILQKCVDMGCEFGKAYKTYRSVPRVTEKTLTVEDMEGEEIFFDYFKISINKDINGIKVKLKKVKRG